MARHEKKLVNTGREWGVDFLRILSMYLVVILHILGAGGVLDAASAGSTRYWVAWLMEAGAYCAVNCFALISGFVMADKTVKPHRLVSLWMQVLLYSVGMTLLVQHFQPDKLIKWDIIVSCFPVIGNRYWYFTAYFMLFLFLPVLNKGIQALTRRQHFGMLAALLGVAFFTRIVGDQALNGDPYFEGGYSFTWLAILYLLGAYLHRYVKKENVNGWLALAGYLAFSGMTFGVRFCIKQLPDHRISSRVLYSYLSPTVVGAAVMLFLFCWTLRFPHWLERVIGAVSPLAFSVYLIHTCPAVFNFVVADSCRVLAERPALRMAGEVLLLAGAVFVGCAAVDVVRAGLFRLLRVDSLCQKLAGGAAGFADRLLQ